MKVDEFPHKYDLIVILELSAKPPNSACKISFNNGISSRKIPETYGGLYMKIMQVFRTSKPTTTSLKQSHLTLIGNMEGQLAYKYSFHIIFDPKVGVHDKFIEKLSVHNLILETDKERFKISLSLDSLFICFLNPSTIFACHKSLISKAKLYSLIFHWMNCNGM